MNQSIARIQKILSLTRTQVVSFFLTPSQIPDNLTIPKNGEK